ncbi:putative quinol monooxygenase [Methylococcus sp. EFPC2]|uniref:putative quinol monooxygenase n=1 Tax=Methylococcus sp. EFPC2 TaxID=2812648 RepID=UPI0019674F25|nr:antibiotic biosynthesis monooxygenase family protein [Methylococcus sp. EFPC2]QSA96183.1 antibiotic biosynthesis monooxygenase [Methylococcus sp. EFPC2]
MRGAFHLLFATLFANLVFVHGASAEEPSKFNVVYYEALPQAKANVASALKAEALASAKGHGVAEAKVLKEIGREERLLVYKALGAEGEPAETSSAAQPAAAPSDTRRNGVIWESPKKPVPAKAVWVVTHVDVTPEYKDSTAEALKALGAANATLNGHVQTIVGQQLNRGNHFTLIEIWANRAAFDAYQGAKSTLDYRTKIAPALGSPYDARLHQSVN